MTPARAAAWLDAVIAPRAQALDVVGPDAALQAELDRAAATLLALVDDGEHHETALPARGDVTALMGRCAHAAVAASAGSANLASHAAQRIWRECLVFTVLSQSADVRAATLTALAPGAPEDIA